LYICGMMWLSSIMALISYCRMQRIIATGRWAYAQMLFHLNITILA
jgi:hypothetical protein